ncbi:Spy/CpxP family protein refolding chaperone [Sediminicurvatus halobius]|uniref:Zinc resistance-associated protein n=1 Tax=Sediminicurvatus halobius TaxID=2182432 RepID=A0A2U2N6E9_9GAMM|nr:Spy/CpxP family protein refolding chaperone [Spiribacter halobius]PWG64514.1 hypothetical protein DEM34_04075 [Spiribacter halobius]UEX79165.1 Spy/CpxP family protein refolding chaperone [Spiribacter halobius]
MIANRTYKAALGLSLLLSAGAVGTASAHGMMGGGMPGGAQSQGMMENCPMVGAMMHGGYGPMMGGYYGMPDMHEHGMGMMQGGGMGMPGMGMGLSGPGAGMMSGLELEDEQQERMRERRSEFRREQLTRMADMLDLRDEMHALMAEQRPDPEAVRELHGRMADIRGEMMAERVRMRNAIQDMLTEEQRQRMHEYRQGGRGMPGSQNMPGNGSPMGQQQGQHGSQSR